MEPITERSLGVEREYEVSGSELGVAGCEEVFRGPSAGDVVEQVVDHLRREHKIRLPDADVILQREYDDTGLVRDVARAVVGSPISEEASIIVRRLREKLNIGVTEDDERLRGDLTQG